MYWKPHTIGDPKRSALGILTWETRGRESLAPGGGSLCSSQHRTLEAVAPNCKSSSWPYKKKKKLFFFENSLWFQLSPHAASFWKSSWMMLFNLSFLINLQGAFLDIFFLIISPLRNFDHIDVLCVYWCTLCVSLLFTWANQVFWSLKHWFPPP